MRTVAIIQARLGSTRLPGKVLADVCGKPLLQRVVDRVRECDMVDEVVVAYPMRDEAISEALSLMLTPRTRPEGETTFTPTPYPDPRADENDVLGRFARAAWKTDAGIIVRITGDCPLVDPALVDACVALWLQDGGYVTSAHANACHFPRGAGCEVFGARLLRKANREATEASDREHVTPWIMRNTFSRWLMPNGHPVVIPAGDALPLTAAVPGIWWEDDDEHGRWCVDEQADLDFVRAVYEHLDDPLAGWREVLRVVEEHDLAKINAHVQQRTA